MVIKIKNITNKQKWEQFVLNNPDANFLQSWNWGVFHQQMNDNIFRLGFYKRNKLMGVCLMVKEKAKRATYITIPGGPILDWNDRELIKCWLNKVKKIAKQESVAFTRCRPQLTDSLSKGEIFTNLGFRPSPMHLHAEYTLILDLTMSEAEILKQMRKNHRREIKKVFGNDVESTLVDGQERVTTRVTPTNATINSNQKPSLGVTKSGIEIELSTNPEDIREFYEVQLELAKKHHFVPFSYQYLFEQFKAFIKDNQVLLIKAFEGNKLLAAAYVIYYGPEAVYHYGISTEYNRNKPGAYACQWAAILEAKRRSCKRYNFWGIVPKEAKDHRFYGPSLFKRGFGGEELKYLPAHDLPHNWRYWPNWVFENVRKKLRHL